MNFKLTPLRLTTSVLTTSALSICGLICGLKVGLAQPKAQSTTSTAEASATESTRDFRAYASLIGFANGSFITEPKSKPLLVNGQNAILPYPLK